MKAIVQKVYHEYQTSLDKIERIHQICLEKNKGKGNCKLGFEIALCLEELLEVETKESKFILHVSLTLFLLLIQEVLMIEPYKFKDYSSH